MKKLFMPVFVVLLSLSAASAVFAADSVIAMALTGQPAPFTESFVANSIVDAALVAPDIPVAPTVSQGADLAAALGLSPDGLFYQVIYWLFWVVGAATALLRLLVMITGVTPNTKDDMYVARAARLLSMLMSLLDRFVAWGLPADKARRQ